MPTLPENDALVPLSAPLMYVATVAVFPSVVVLLPFPTAPLPITFSFVSPLASG
jgi:hypothetical protein